MLFLIGLFITAITWLEMIAFRVAGVSNTNLQAVISAAVQIYCILQFIWIFSMLVESANNLDIETTARGLRNTFKKK